MRFVTEDPTRMSFGALMAATNAIPFPIRLPIVLFFKLRGFLRLPMKPAYATLYPDGRTNPVTFVPDYVQACFDPFIEAAEEEGLTHAFTLKANCIGPKELYVAYYLDSSGLFFCEINWQRAGIGEAMDERITFACESVRTNGKILTSLAVNDNEWLPEIFPPTHEVVRVDLAPPDPTGVIQAHRERIRRERDLVRFNPDSLLQHVRKAAQRLYDHMLDRGFFMEISETDVRRLMES